jgi:transposase
MSVFASSKKATSCAVLCPGNGQRLSGGTRKGNRWLRGALWQAAWGASRKKDCFLNFFFQRHKARQGAQNAVIANRAQHPGNRLLHPARWQDLSGARRQFL